MTATLDDVLTVLKEIADQTKPHSALIDRHEFADLLAIGLTNFDTLRSSGKIGPVPCRLGGSLRWNRAEVLEWLRRTHSDGDLFTTDEWAKVRRQSR